MAARRLQARQTRQLAYRTIRKRWPLVAADYSNSCWFLTLLPAFKGVAFHAD